MKIKLLIFKLKNWILKTTLDLITWCKKRYADYLAGQSGHWYYVFRIGWKFRILNVKEVDFRKLTDIKYAKRKLKIKHAKIHSTYDFRKHCIYTARPQLIKKLK